MFAMFFMRDKDTHFNNLEIHSICQLTNIVEGD